MYSSNLKRIRESKNLSIAKLSEIIGIPARTLTAYERSERTPSIELVSQLCKKMSVNINWFLTGNGEMYITACNNTHKFIKNDKLSDNFKNWGSRLNKVLSENEKTPRDFSKITGIKENRIEDFILNSVEPTMSEITLIKSNIDISMDELLYAETFENRENIQTQNISLTANEILKLKKLLEISNI